MASHAFAQIAPVAREVHGVAGSPMLVEVRVGARDALVGVELVEAEPVRGTPKAPRPLAARLIWPVLPAPGGEELMRWAAASNPARFTDARPGNSSVAYLAIEVPADLGTAPPRGLQIQVKGGGGALLRVHAPAPEDLLASLAARASMIAPQGDRDPLLSLPDPSAPLERFRHEIGCAMRGWPEPPAFDEGSADELAARANNALWRSALARTFAAGAGPTTELAELLVATCTDATAPAPIAAWIAGPDELASILQLALSSEFTGDALAGAVNEFVRVRMPLLWWVEDSDARSVTIAFANPTTRPQVVRYHWVIGTEEDMLPLAVEISAAEVRRARIARPTLERPRLLAEQPEALERLRLACEGTERTIVVPPAFIAVGPVGAELAEFHPPLTLPLVSPGARTPRAISTSTRVALRERLAGWELFIESRAAIGADERLVATGGDSAVVAIAPDGTLDSEGCSVTPEVLSFARHGDRFRAAFFVPPEWIRRDLEVTRVEVGFRRSVAGGFVDAPFPTVPWSTAPRRLAFDLSSRQ